MRSTFIAALIAIIVVHVCAPAAGAQTCTATGGIEGRALSESGSNIGGVQLTASGAAPVTTDSAGRFRIPRVCAGVTAVRARRLGFAATTVSVTVPADSTIRVNVTLAAMPLHLAPVLVHADKAPGSQRLREFYMRRQRNPGYFLTRDDLEAFENSRLTDALRARVPGVQVSSGGGAIPNRLRIRGQRCAPMVWLDGMSTPSGEFDLDVLQPSSIAAIEVYSGPATIPVEFRTPFGRDGCGGAIVVWSRVGRDDWDAQPPRQKARTVADAGAQLPVYQPDEVDTQARVDSAAMPVPAYPDSLHAFQVEGSAIAEFVVDTTGQALPGSIRIVTASAPAFGRAVLRAIAAARFIPARKANLAVRQLMQLPFEFTMAPPP